MLTLSSLPCSAEVIVGLAVSLGSVRRPSRGGRTALRPVAPRMPSLKDLAKFRSYCRDLAASLTVLPRDIGVMIMQSRSAARGLTTQRPPSALGLSAPLSAGQKDPSPPPPLPEDVMAHLDAVRRDAAARMAKTLSDGKSGGGGGPMFDPRGGGPAAGTPRTWTGPSTFI